MRLLVFGAGGQLGTDVIKRATRDGIDAVGVTHHECDITDQAAVRSAIYAAQADAVVNCAAWTKVDAAEDHEQQARAINGDGAGTIATAAAQRGIRCCHISTDYVFDGAATSPISEDAQPNPASAYGRTKYAGEQQVRAALGDRALIVRTAWLYGAMGPNFVLTMLRLARERGALRVVADQIGSPTWTADLAPAILTLLQRDATGIFHVTNSAETSWHGFARAIVACAGLGSVQVEAITTDEYPTPARRPKYSVLDNAHWRSLGEQPLPSWEEGLRGYLNELDERAAVTA